MNRLAALAGACAAALAPWAAAAVPLVTNIAPDASAGTLTGLAGPNLHVIEGGTRAGTNLFHSFQTFDLAAGDTAVWFRAQGDGAQITNIINRVTGGDPSHIDGELTTLGMPNASFWFINPAGIVFGAGASINVPNAAHFSTAQALIFADNAVFTTATPNGSTFSMAAPAAFGFLGGQGDISVNGVVDQPGATFLPAGASLQLTAGNVSIVNSGFDAFGLDLAAVGSASGTLPVQAAAPHAFGNGTLLVDDSLVDSFPLAAGGGGVSLGADQVVVAGSAGAGLFAFTNGAVAGGNITVSAGLLEVEGGTLQANTMTAGAGGTVTVTAADVDISGGSVGTLAFGTGDAGAIQVTATQQLSLENGGVILSGTGGSSSAGAIDIQAGAMTMNSGALIASGGVAGSSGAGGNVTIQATSFEIGATASIGTSEEGTGPLGAVSVTAGTIDVDGGTIGSVTTTAVKTGDVRVDGMTSVLVHDGGRVSTETEGAGGAGNLTVEGGLVTIDGGTVTSSTSGAGDAGALNIAAGVLTVENGGDITSEAVSGTGDAGLVSVEANSVSVLNGGGISSSTGDRGHGGEVDIQAGAVDLDGGIVAAASQGQGDAGSIVIGANTLALTDGAAIDSDTLASGRGGAISLDVGTLTVNGASHITSSSEGSGSGGTVNVTAQSLAINDGFILSTTAGAGAGGDAMIQAGTLTIDNGAISAEAESGSSGRAGDVGVNASSILLTDDGVITSPTFGSGDAGDVSVTATNLTLQSGATINTDTEPGATGAAGSVRIDAGAVSLDDAGISSQTFSSGDAGDVSLTANTLALTDGAQVSSFTSASGNAGSIDLGVGTLSLASGGRILSSQATNSATGDAGAIVIVADSLTVDADPAAPLAISTSIFNTGAAGAVTITAPSITLDGGGIGSSARGLVSGASGDVTIVTRDLEMTNGAHIETVSLNPDTAGAIDISAQQVDLDSGAVITSANQSSAGGAAGAIQIAANTIRLLNGGEVTTNSAAGAAGDIVLTLPSNGELQLAGASAPGVITTSSGPGTGGRITISDPFLILSDGGRILALGQEGGANVRLTADFFIRSSDRLNLVSVNGSLIVDSQVSDLSRGAQVTDLSFLDASAVLRSQCAAAGAAGQTSRLSVRAPGPSAGGAASGGKADQAQPPRVGGCQP